MSQEQSTDIIKEVPFFPYPCFGEEQLYIKVIETKLLLPENQAENIENKIQNKQKHDSEKINLKAIGCYNDRTQKVRLQLESSMRTESITFRLCNRGNDLPKSIIRVVTNAKAKKSKFLEISINEVDRHVFYKTLTLIYKYQIIGSEEEEAENNENLQDCYESKLQFEVNY